ncbi:MAG: hypothetical protein H6799_01275 [Candidatus Nomurabacteria bacterium]|nr:MAG: hypothetical protein H6799_01275 [Candidatus Nomurabacteria bacterium]HRV75920.1 hypothetical protein [Candidatus Saccharimonadales bacterium]
MIEHIWTIICKESKIDSDTNSITIIDALENLNFDIPEAEVNFQKGKTNLFNVPFEIVSMFYRDKKGRIETHDYYVDIIDPSSKQIGKVEAKIRFEPQHNRMRSRIKFDTIGVTTEGVYKFKLYLKKKGEKDKLLTSIPLEININFK